MSRLSTVESYEDSKSGARKENVNGWTVFNLSFTLVGDQLVLRQALVITSSQSSLL